MGVLAVLVTALAQAGDPTARLAFSSEAPACTEQHLREAVAARLGYDPFVPDAPLGVAVKISTGADDTLDAQVTVSATTRPFSGPADCQQLLDDIALVLAGAITAPRETPKPHVEAVKPEPEPAASPLAVALLVNLGAELGQQPTGTGGLRAGARIGTETFTGLLEATVNLPTHARFAGGTVDTFFFGGDTGVCAAASLFSGCALVRVGALRYQGIGFNDTRAGWLPSVSAGARAAVEWPSDSTVAFQASAEARVPITPMRLVIDDTLLWQQGWVVASLGVALLVRVQ